MRQAERVLLHGYLNWGEVSVAMSRAAVLPSTRSQTGPSGMVWSHMLHGPRQLGAQHCMATCPGDIWCAALPVPLSPLPLRARV